MLDLPLHHLVCLFLASLCSIPALVQISKRSLGVKDPSAYNEEGLYEDEDGVASDRIQQMGMGNVPQVLILVCSVVGLFLSSVAIVNLARSDGNRMPLAPWLIWGIWV